MRKLDVTAGTGCKATVETVAPGAPAPMPGLALQRQRPCSKCNANPRRGDHAYCTPCLREWARGRRASESDRRFTQGAESMRAAVIQLFRNVGRTEINGLTAVELVAVIRLEG